MKKTILALALLAAFLVVPGLPSAPGHPGAAFAQAEEPDDAELMDTEALDGEEADGEEDEGERTERPPREELSAEAVALREVIGDYAIAMTNFPARKDVEAITRHFTEDYAKFNDGLEETASDTAAIFNEIREQIVFGSMVVITSKIDDFYGEVRGDLAWATYRFYFKTIVAGELFTEEDKFCSAVLEKSGETWLIRLEHCTSVFADDLLD